ncbi:MAG: methionine--tRNA ligase [Patescibacteria group bacterium]
MKYFISTPIYYVNDKPHAGHAYTTILADVLARVHRLRAHEVFFLTGTDEHGEKVARKAREQGLSPKQFADKTARSFEEMWKKLNISQDDFIRTTDLRHKKGVERIVREMHRKGDIYEADYRGLYCVGCEKFITKKELINGKCPDHKCRPKVIKERNYFFKLSGYIDEVKRLIKKDELLIRPVRRKKEVLGLFSQGMEDFSISRESVKWGIEFPFDKKQRVYVWADALTNYITALDYGDKGSRAELMRKFWPIDAHIIGKDILKFHAIYWPAMLLSLGLKLPKKIFVHGFFMIEGEKMSKTIGNVIDPGDLVKKWGADATRYLLLNQFPSQEDGDISIRRLEAQYEADLANDLGNLLQRTLVMMNKYKVPAVECEGNPYNQEVHNQFSARCPNAYSFSNKELLDYLDDFRIMEALGIIKEVISGGNKYIEKEKPWELAKKDKEQCKYVLQGLYNRLALIAMLIEPFMPGVSVEMKRQLKEMRPEPMFHKQSGK